MAEDTSTRYKKPYRRVKKCLQGRSMKKAESIYEEVAYDE